MTEAVRIFLRKRGKGPSVAPEYVAKGLKCSVEDAAAALEALRGESVKQTKGETHERTADSWSIEIPNTRIHTLEQLLKYCEVDETQWEVERFTVNKWEVGAKDAGGDIQVTPLYQVKAQLKKKVAVITARQEIDAMLADLRKRGPKYAAIKPAPQPTGNMLELSLPDAHLGKLAWSDETGWENYDVRIAEQVFKDAFSALLQRTNNYKFDRVLLVPGNDFLHSNGKVNATAAGTPQDCDGRNQRTFRVARELTIWSAEQALKIAPHVDILPIPGNHDPEPTFYLSEVLAAWFRNTPEVTVDNSPRSRKLYQWGDVAIMFTHRGGKGDRGASRNRLTMATEYRQAWGEAKFCEIHTGDLHQVRLEEEFGVRVRILPSLCAPDAWHSESQYIGNTRSAEAYVWNRTEGLLNVAFYNVPNQGPRTEAA